MSQFLNSFGDELVKLAAEPKKKKKKSLLRKALTLGLGGAAAYGAYRYGRKVKMSKDPLLRAMQQKSKGRMTHVDILPEEYMNLPRPKGERLVRSADEIVAIPEAAAIERAGKVQMGKAKPREFEGAVHTGADPYEMRGIKSDLSLSTTPKERVSGITTKLEEAKYLEATGAAAKSESAATYIDKVKGGAPKNTADTLDALQAELAKKYPNGYVVKPLEGSVAPGVPTHKDRFADVLTKGNPEHQKWMGDMLKNPKDYMVQEYIPIAKERVLIGRPPPTSAAESRTVAGGLATKGKLRFGAKVPTEYRVHVYGGKVIPGGSVHRWAGGSELSPFRQREIKRMEAEIQKAVNKLPENRMNIPMAMDVVKTTDGKWRIIEANIGTQSGFVAPQIGKIPTPSKPAMALYKAVTGRQSQLEAGIKATGAGVGTTAVAGKMMSGSPMQGEA
jgi:hypothetical protein